MRILLDENLPRKLVEALRSEGHQDEFVDDFLSFFRHTDSNKLRHGDSWPA
ncbi:MAG TPA: DUF5615 family PIN-like protein [Candidatus Baltobacteraceae bacterium]|nr:DUF5615 family PIN-like protein [Candidatus Baltobacteraceae bacterium]